MIASTSLTPLLSNTWLPTSSIDLRRTPLKKGEITARGLNLLDGTRPFPTHLEIPNTYALTGGTDAYARTRGQVIELYNKPDDRELYIEL